MPTSLSPRKAPSQERSRATVNAIYEAAVQVLLRDGYQHLTTTRVAEAAGVSVGSLYQYFPNKQSILVALMKRHLEHLEQCLIDRVRQGAGQPFEVQARGMITTLLDIKLETLTLSKALRVPMAEAEGRAMVVATIGNIRDAMASTLKKDLNLPIDRASLVAIVLLTAIEGAVSFSYEQDVETLRDPAFREELIALASSYLKNRG